MIRQNSEKAGRRRHHPEKVIGRDDNPLGLQDVPSPAPRRPWRWIGLFAFVLLSMAMLATVIVVTAARDKKTSLLLAEESRLEESVSGRVSVLQTWLHGQRSASRRLTESHVFRLFAADLANQDPRLPLPRSLQDQRPYFRQLMAEFAKQNDLVRATVMRGDGVMLLSSPGPTLPVADLLRQHGINETKKGITYSLIRRIEGRDGDFVVDAITDIPGAQEEDVEAANPSAFLVLTLPMGPVLREILSNASTASERERITLLQQRGNRVEQFRLVEGAIEIEASEALNGIRPGTSAAFAHRKVVDPVYSLAKAVSGVSWTLEQALDAKAALAPMDSFIRIAVALSAMAVLLLTTAFSSLWWRRDRDHHRQLVEFYKEYTDRTDRQRQFLHSITTSIGDWITVSSPSGEIIYANPAFMAAMTNVQPSTQGKTWNELVKVSPAIEALQDDVASLVDANSFQTVEIGNKRRIISSHTTDLCSNDGGIQGTVRVVRDYSNLVAERQRRLLSLAQTVDAFIHAIELRDPFLLGHTERVRTHAIAVGRQLGLSHNDLATLALAASLSQIGKIFIPDHILAKPGRHDTAEEQIMRDHILHAVDILQRIDFAMPIADVVAQMHERLDGSGYPHGLAGEQIGLSARILGVADVFCARTAPRSYRDRSSAGKTLYHLASNDRRYDLKVVAALAEIVSKGDEIIDRDMIEGAFLDSSIWRRKYHQMDRIQEPA